MTDIISSDWTELDADNTNPSPNGIQGGYQPSTIAPILRNIRGAIKRDHVRTNPYYTTTGSGNAYVLTYVGAPLAYTKGDKYQFFTDRTNTGAATININSLGAKSIIMPDGSALTANQIKAGRVVEIIYNGTSFVMNGYVDQNLKIGDMSANTLVLTTALAVSEGGTGSTTAAGARTSLGTDNANNITTGTLADARLPTSMTGKTFTGSTLAFEYSAKVNRDGQARAQFGVLGSTAYSPYMTRLAADGSTFTGHIRLADDTSTGFKHNVSGTDYTVWTSGNDGSGSGLDADLLDGQDSTYYRNASNINAGTLADARLPTSMAGKTFTSDVHVNGADFTVDHTTSADIRLELNNILSGRLYRDVSGGVVMRRYNETTGAAEGYIQLMGNGVNDFKYNGFPVWHTGNDGAASGLDADLLDGYHASDLFRDNADFTSTGNMTLSNGAPYIRLQDTTTSAYDGRIRLDASNLYIDGSSDGTNYAEVLRFELDTKVGYMSQLFLTTSGEAIRLAAPTAGQDPYISWYSGATRTGYIQYTDTGTTTGFYITNDISDDKLGIDNSGGTSALRFWDNSRSALDVVLTSANIDNYDLAKYTTSSSNTLTDFPVGSVILARGTVDRQASASIWLDPNTTRFTTVAATTQLIGTWRARGQYTENSNNMNLFQRVA
ncbi:hypothetical protein I7F13_05060 [Sinorhizobium meliloti]|uniref:hypothetical protein n=1 Tax=Rhizobium meliloti TaxID=382 RepID=UPI000FD78B82|nr:hypothetical protein [Sinorhizobium meliloti]MDE3821800.1 hypothetical protein [Sinorhizobium meliloti]RVM47221.1 hypothetical protein CN127_18920 [Sinorhizobium meliloti]RVN75549.1 hypothetical protein CN106_00905 [Sinorhizobium meliloti]